MKSILNSKTEDTKLIVLVKRNKNKKYKVKFRFYKLEKDGVTEIAAIRANTTISKTVAEFLKSEGFKVVEEGIGWKVLF